MRVKEPTFIGYVPSPSVKEAGAYCYRHLETGQTYIGSTVNGYGRFIQHTSALERGDHVNKAFQKAYDKSPFFELDFIRIPPDRAVEDPLKVVREIEQILLDSFEDKSKLLNIARDVKACGSGISPSAETRAKISKSLMGRKASPESRRRRSESLMGHVVSEETKRKISETRSGFKQSEENRQKSKEAAMLRARPVCVVGVTYPSVAEAARSHDMAISTINKRLRSKNPRFTDWSFANAQLLNRQHSTPTPSPLS